jgi:dGTPase
MRDHGGFEHNLQSLRVVDHLEESYPQFNGINLSFETREGILKHCSRVNAQALEAREPGGVGRRFLDGSKPSLEAQLCNLADEIAYNAHDIDDGVRSGLISMDQLQEVTLFEDFHAQVLREFPELTKVHNQRRLLFETIRRMLSAQVYDLIAVSQTALAAAMPQSPDAVRQQPPLLSFGSDMRRQSLQLKQFLFSNLYRHDQVMQTTGLAKQVVRELFAAYMASPHELPANFGAQPDPSGLSASEPALQARVVADYIAGMTDRFAAREHERLSGQRLLG